jgi:hypothetical protein
MLHRQVKFTDSRCKIRRANKHIAEVDAIIDSFHQPDAYTVEEGRDSQTGQKLIKYGFAKQLSIEDLAVAIGDAVHNLKCALDYAWVHVIKKVAPIAVRKFGKFPVYPSQSKLEDALRGHGIQSACPDLYDLIVTQIKPYDGGDLCLYSIHTKDIADKHRLLTPVLDVATVDITLEDDNGNTNRILCAFTRGGAYRKPIEDNQKLKHKGGITLHIVFEEALPTIGVDVSPVLHNFSVLTLSVVETLEAFLEAVR